MTANAIVAGVFADLKTVRTRSIVQMVIEIPVERAEEVVAMFGFPQPGAEIAVAVARLVAEPVAPAAPEPSTDGKPKRTWDDMTPSQQAGLLCGEVGFQRWIKVDGKDAAAEFVRAHCGVRSRSDINDDNPKAREAWNRLAGKYRDFQRYGDMR